MITRTISYRDPETRLWVTVDVRYDAGSGTFNFECPVPDEEDEEVDVMKAYAVRVDAVHLYGDRVRLICEQFEEAEQREYERISGLRDTFYLNVDEDGLLPEDFRLSPEDQEFFDSNEELQLVVLGLLWLNDDDAPWERKPGTRPNTYPEPVTDEGGNRLYDEEGNELIKRVFLEGHDDEKLEQLKRLHETRPDLYKALPSSY